jgi:ribonuclease HI
MASILAATTADRAEWRGSGQPPREDAGVPQGSLFDDPADAVDDRPATDGSLDETLDEAVVIDAPAAAQAAARRSPTGTTTIVYTDGACRGNPGPGGWAWAVPGGRFASGAEAQSTNQRMELQAALEAVRALDDPLEVVSDSTYVVNCFRDKWWEGWQRRGWKNSAKQPVANRDIWEPLVELVVRRGVKFRWVKGHNGDPMNDLVDRLAVEAAAAQTGRAGVS